jgi:hypothetical protein
MSVTAVFPTFTVRVNVATVQSFDFTFRWNSTLDVPHSDGPVLVTYTW